MKFLWHVILLIVVDGMTPVTAASPTPAGMNNTEIVWSVPTNAWPENLWVYKVIPQTFSPAVISNLMGLAHFTKADENAAARYKAEVDKDAIVYGILDGTCKHLIICPTLGFINYHDPTAFAHSQLEVVTNVPNQAEATTIGLELLRRIGVDVDQIAVKSGSHELDLHWQRETLSFYDEKAGKELTLTNTFAVYFLRRVDGLNVAGIGYHGGVYISFGNHGKVADLRLTWRNLQPYQILECASVSQVAKWIKAGKLALHYDKGPRPFQTLSIYKASLLYDGSGGEKLMEFVYPYVVVEATATDAKSTNTLWFKAPLTLSEESWNVVK